MIPLHYTISDLTLSDADSIGKYADIEFPPEDTVLSALPLVELAHMMLDCVSYHGHHNYDSNTELMPIVLADMICDLVYRIEINASKAQEVAEAYLDQGNQVEFAMEYLKE